MKHIYYYIELNNENILLDIDDFVGCLETKDTFYGIVSYRHTSEFNFSLEYIGSGCISKNMDNDKLILLRLKGCQYKVVEWEFLSDKILSLLSGNNETTSM